MYAGFGWVLIGLAVLGAIVALVRRPAIFLFAVPYAVSAFLLYSCWFRPDRRYIIGVFSMIPFLIAEGIFGAIDLLHLIATRRGEVAVFRSLEIGPGVEDGDIFRNLSGRLTRGFPLPLES